MAHALATGPLRTLTLDGVRVRYLDVGDGEPLVLLHGYPQSHYCWRHQIATLARHRRVIAPDWQAWGASERSLALDCAYEVEVARIGRFLDALELETVDLAAHDYGGFLGLGFVIGQPMRVRRFAIVNSRAHRTFPAPYYQQFALLSFLARRPALRPLLLRLPLGAIHRRSLAGHVRRGCFDRVELERYVAWMDTRDGRRWFAHFFAGYEVAIRPALAAGLAGIACPTAVIWGDRDPYCPFATAEDLATRIPHARLFRVAGADHYVMEERPAEVLAALEQWLDVRAPVTRIGYGAGHGVATARGDRR
jgi:pimeloyl-ACP methyl ester carboxylesterase